MIMLQRPYDQAGITYHVSNLTAELQDSAVMISMIRGSSHPESLHLWCRIL